MAKISIDAGATYLPICADCGWRGLPTSTRESARSQGYHHERRAHPGDREAATATASARYRRR